MLQHGVGTITFYEPETKEFAALGHGILDVDTSKLIDIGKGELVTSKIVSIVKGENGKPGEIKGSIENGTSIGEINKNTFFGIYGKINNSSPLNINTKNALEVANRSEIKTGEATIFCTLDDTGPQEYKINIDKIYYNNNSNNKSMLISVTDEKLIEKTGGILFSKFIQLVEPFPFTFEVSLVLVLIGIVVGMIGSSKAVRKYLKI